MHYIVHYIALHSALQKTGIHRFFNERFLNARGHLMYLQGELEDGETVYCLPPPGYENERIGSDGRPMIATR